MIESLTSTKISEKDFEIRALGRTGVATMNKGNNGGRFSSAISLLYFGARRGLFQLFMGLKIVDLNGSNIKIKKY